MDKREKVELGLKACTEIECPDECPYKRDGDPNYCQHRLHRDALEVLNEEPIIIEAMETGTDRFFKWSCIVFAWAMMIYFVVKVIG